MIENSAYFQIFGIVNNAVMNNFAKKIFLCISNYSLRLISLCQIVKSFSLWPLSPLFCYLGVVKLKIRQAYK